MASADDSRAPSESRTAEGVAKPRPLKISVKRTASFAVPATASPIALTPSSADPRPAASLPPTPSSSAPPKIRIKTPATALPPLLPAISVQTRIVSAGSDRLAPLTKTKAGRTLKPTPKKRARQDDDDDFHTRPIASSSRGAQASTKRIKITTTPSTLKAPALPGRHPQQRPAVVIKKPGRKPVRPPGQGYDSEAEDREDDPVIEEQFVLRMLPGEHAEYVHKAIKEKRIGISRQQGGADIALKWLDEHSRRACLTVEGQPYAAIMVDLPTVTESMKTWNKKQMVKSADVCQMLLVFAKVKSELEAKEAELPPMVGKGFTWPHGLTPPMHDCVHRRFRKRLSKLEIQNKEEEVSRLLRADKDAVLSTYEFIEDKPETAVEQYDEEVYGEEDEDAEGEAEVDGEADADGEADDIGYFPAVDRYEHEAPDEEHLRTMAAEIEAEFMDFEMDADVDADSGTPAEPVDGRTPMSAAQSGTPAAAESGPDEDANSVVGGGAQRPGPDEEDGEDDDDDDELDEEAQARADEVRGVREDAAELQRQLTKLQADLVKQSNMLLRRRVEGNIKKVKNELQLKLSSIGEDFEQ